MTRRAACSIFGSSRFASATARFDVDSAISFRVIELAKLNWQLTLSRPSPWLLAFAAMIAAIVLGQGISAPFTKDAEPQSAEWIQSVAEGHLLAPRDDYGFLTQKPLLYYWLSAAVTHATGGVVDEIRARVVAVAAGVVLATIILAWTCANVGALEGWLAFVFILGTYGFASRAPLALTDMLLTLLVFAALVILYPIVQANVARGWRVVAAIVVLQLGVLTKGPIALVLTALAIIFYLLMLKRNPLRLLRERWVWETAIPVLAMTAAWYAIWFRFGSPHLARTFITENFGHFMPARAGGTGESARPIWFIVARVIGGAMPLVLLVPAAIVALARGEFAEPKRRAILYAASLTIAVIVLFSIASAKRDDYILPALPGIAIQCAALFGLGGDSRSTALRLCGVAVAVIAVLVLAALAALAIASLAHASVSQRLVSSDAELLGILFSGIRTGDIPLIVILLAIVAAAIAALLALARDDIARAGLGVGILSLAASLLFTAVVRPRLAAERSVREFAPFVHERIDGAPLCIVSGINYELSFYYGAAVPDLKAGGCADKKGAPAYLFAYASEMDSLKPALRARLSPVLQSNLLGGPGSPALYEITP
jgi:4-amino-4-deoxy-L-arabinose transferase-like glycosyltransferase